MDKKYHSSGCLLSDVDWIIETSKAIYMIEYKNASVEGAVNPGAFNPRSNKKIDVLSISEWNEDPKYGEFPIQHV